MNLKPRSAHHNIYFKNGSCLLIVTLELTTFTLQHDTTDKTILNSFHLVFIVLITYSQQVSIFMKLPYSTM